MALLDLSLVSSALIRLLERYVPMSPVWGGTPPASLVITGDPPDLVKQAAGDHVLTVYLFHVEEDAARKNHPLPHTSAYPPIRYQPMGLSLYYLLGAFGGTRAGSNAFVREQRLLGIAMKAFHDHPALSRRTIVPNPTFAGDQEVFPAEMRDDDDRLSLSLHPLGMEAATRMWQANDVPLRLSTVYEVSVALIEAERPPTEAVPVLTRVVSAEPWTPSFISATARSLMFTDPQGASRQVMVSPALVSVGESFTIRGVGLGDPQARLIVSSVYWAPPHEADATSWITSRSDGQVEATAASPVSGQPLVPGLYSLSLRGRRMANNTAHLAVMAALPVLAPASAAPGAQIEIQGGPFSGAGVRSVDVFIGPASLTRANAAPAAGQFQITASDRIRARLPTDRPDTFQPGAALPVRVVVNEIFMPPTVWLTVT